uniref:Alpha-1,3-mannosyl-glycoprotein 4-beta-N-acetylglucosaminyltransferase C n=1 Tax=Callorhinchus milii TaxID=7868 RepID=A0A4W3GVY7_CALMI
CRRESYLAGTLQSIFEKSSPEELEEMVVVIYLADFDVLWSINTAKEIEAKFGSHIDAGHLVVIRCPQDIYPTLEGLKRNFNDPDARVRYRSKQNVDYAFLVNSCTKLSDYFLMLEDDVLCAKNFVSLMKRFVASVDSSWTTLMFSKLGYIGKLYHSADLAKLARFLLMFYDEMPCDWLLEHFHRVKAQPEEIRFRPSLFQHMGNYSSFQAIRNKLKDDDFVEVWNFPDNPTAMVYTDIEVHKQYQPIKAYNTRNGYFWGISPKMGNYFLLIFVNSIRIKKLQVLTGSNDPKADMLVSGIVELGRGRVTTGTNVSCTSYSKLGDFREGKIEMENFMTETSDKVDCIRVLVTRDQIEWLIINRINVWILKEK